MGWTDQTGLVLGLAMRTFQAPRVVWRPDVFALELSAIFRAAHVSVDPETQARIASTSPTLDVRLADLPEPPAQGNLVDVDATRYVVAEIEPDGEGAAKLVLKRKAST